MTRSFFLFLAALMFSIPVYSQGQTYRLTATKGDSQVAFGIRKIHEALRSHGWKIAGSADKSAAVALEIYVTSDSVVARSMIRKSGWRPAKSYGDQCYTIRIYDKGVKKSVYIFAGETTGAMYGELDIAEAINCNRLDQLKESDNAPYITRRGIKYNIPMDLRTPSYSDPGDAHQQNIPNTWDLEFWQSYFDEMAVHRYNVMTWWSLQPFPSMVKIPEYPETALNDVWRTKEKYDESFSSRGFDFDRAYLFRNVEIIRKMTIDEKITFWRKVMQMAADRGIDIYLFTWNMFTYGVDGKYGITRKQDNPATIAWYRAAVREMIKTYPLLRGIGITAGEGMDDKLKGEFANEKWLWKTYGEGIRDGLKGQPSRPFTLIHRFHWASLNEILTEFKELPCKLELSLKYAIAHMYSVPNPQFVLPAMPLLSPQLQSWLTIRNDDIYSFRWANNDFSREFIRSIPQLQKIAGFYMGPDGYCWGRDYLFRHYKSDKPPLIIQKQWYSFMLWGRLSYNPGTPDEVFTANLAQRFRPVDIKELMIAWSNASMIMPMITRFVWGDIDLKWFPEANLSHPSHKGFYTVKDYIERAPMPGSRIRSILAWVNDTARKTDSLNPTDVADSLSSYYAHIKSSLRKLPQKLDYADTDELSQTISDIEALMHLAKYYSYKIKAACSLAMFDKTRQEIYRHESLSFVSMAVHYWYSYAAIYSAKNKPALYNRVGYVDVDELKQKVEQDVEMVKSWIPGKNNLTTNDRTEVPFRQ
jgi:hypothetical protein